MSIRRLIAGGAAAAALLALAPLTPAGAQANSNDKVLIVYGSDPCPAGTICVRKGESERFRIPRELRESAPSPRNERWADRARSLQTVGNFGTGSCSNTGAGGWTGCWARDMQAVRAAGQADAAATAAPDR